MTGVPALIGRCRRWKETYQLCAPMLARPISTAFVRVTPVISWHLLCQKLHR